MSYHSTYDFLRHMADSWGLVAMTLAWAALGLWAFRPGAKEHHDRAANMIFKDDHDGDE